MTADQTRRDRALRDRRRRVRDHDRPAARPQRRRRSDAARARPTRSAGSRPTTSWRSPILTGAERHVLRRRRPESGRQRSRQPRRVGHDARRTDGPDADGVQQARDRRRRGIRGRRWARAGGDVRPACRRRGRRVRHLLPAMGCAADRRRHDPPPAADRPEPRARHDPHRTRCEWRGGADDGPRQPADAEGRGAGRRTRARPPDRRVSAALHAVRPALELRAVGPVARRGVGQRDAARISP